MNSNLALEEAPPRPPVHGDDRHMSSMLVEIVQLWNLHSITASTAGTTVMGYPTHWMDLQLHWLHPSYAA